MYEIVFVCSAHAGVLIRSSPSSNKEKEDGMQTLFRSLDVSIELVEIHLLTLFTGFHCCSLGLQRSPREVEIYIYIQVYLRRRKHGFLSVSFLSFFFFFFLFSLGLILSLFLAYSQKRYVYLHLFQGLPSFLRFSLQLGFSFLCLLLFLVSIYPSVFLLLLLLSSFFVVLLFVFLLLLLSFCLHLLVLSLSSVFRWSRLSSFFCISISLLCVSVYLSSFFLYFIYECLYSFFSPPGCLSFSFLSPTLSSLFFLQSLSFFLFLFQFLFFLLFVCMRETGLRFLSQPHIESSAAWGTEWKGVFLLL